MQRKLSEGEIEKLKQAKAAISDVLFPAYDDHGRYWHEVLLALGDRIKHGTTDGKPWVEPEPPLTDEDACVWPRRMVMVRSDDLAPWEGPYAYLGKTESFYAVDSLGVTVFVALWSQARRATPEEIEAAK